MTTHSHTLTPQISRGILNSPGGGLESKRAAERLLAQDRDTHHCYFNKLGFHNHLSHHILAAFDLGAPANLLQAIYDDEKKSLTPIHIVNRETGEEKVLDVNMTEKNWTTYLGDEKYYAVYLAFFSSEIGRLGVGETLEKYVFSPEANGNGTDMLLRLVAGAVHPFIQVGFALEFNSPAMVAQGLAMATVTGARFSTFPGVSVPSSETEGARNGQPHAQSAVNGEATHRQPSTGLSVLAILRQAYDSPTFAPVLPYDPDALLSKRMKDAMKDGRYEEIQRLTALWTIDASGGDAEFAVRAEELIWATTLLFAGTGKRGRAPRLDFFIMHTLNSTIFFPSYFRAIPTGESKARLLRAHLAATLLVILIRGRPRIDPALLMSYTAFPSPPDAQSKVNFSKDAIGSSEGETVNPWNAIIADVLHAPDPHTQKAVRLLYYASQKYGDTPPGGAIGAFDAESGKETHSGAGEMDGSIFVRAAGLVMERMGWVTHGQPEGKWDRSALGWHDAWKNDD